MSRAGSNSNKISEYSFPDENQDDIVEELVLMVKKIILLSFLWTFN